MDGKADLTPPRDVIDDNYLLGVVTVLFLLLQLSYILRPPCTC